MYNKTSKKNIINERILNLIMLVINFFFSYIILLKNTGKIDPLIRLRMSNGSLIKIENIVTEPTNEYAPSKFKSINISEEIIIIEML